MLRLLALAAVLVLWLGSVAGSTGNEPVVRLVYHGARNRPVVALTFDDGWSTSRCARIFHILRRRHVAATFFPYARAVRAAPRFWRRVARAGYPIGNHSTTHPDMTRLKRARAEWEIEHARRLIERITRRPMIRVFRPPFGAWDRTVIYAARDAGFPTVLLWDVDAVDWSSAGRRKVLRRALRGSSGSIVLLHCGPRVTPRILEAVIDGYKRRGFDFVTVPQLLARRIPATTLPAPPSTPSPPNATTNKALETEVTVGLCAVFERSVSERCP